MVAEAKGKPWKPIDDITQKLNFVSGVESYESISQHRPKKPVDTPLSVASRGEFGTLMRVVLVMDSANFRVARLGSDSRTSSPSVFLSCALNQTRMNKLNNHSEPDGFAPHGLISALPKRAPFIGLRLRPRRFPAK